MATSGSRQVGDEPVNRFVCDAIDDISGDDFMEKTNIGAADQKFCKKRTASHASPVDHFAHFLQKPAWCLLQYLC